MTLTILKKPVKGVFYQPLNRDADISEQEWQSLLQRVVSNEHLSEVVVQWVQYGDENFGGQSGWLVQRLNAFDRVGLKLWLGLYSDPHYFDRVHSDQATQRTYLTEYFELLLENYNVWRNWLSENQSFIKGVYIPAELSDFDFDTQEKRDELRLHLNQLKEAIEEPVLISVYLSGKTSPESISKWLTDISKIGINVMVQDGRGTQLFDDETWKKYQNELPCHISVIKEVFTMDTQHPTVFERISPEKLAYQFTHNQDCHNSYAFSLRYFPIFDNPLKLRD